MALRTATLSGRLRRVVAGHLYRHRRRRRVAQDLTAYAALIETPHDLGSAAAGSDLPNPLSLPANARLAFSASEALDDGDITVTIGGRNLVLPALSADEIFRLSYGERAESVVAGSDIDAPACDVTLYVLDEWQREAAIATGSVT